MKFKGIPNMVIQIRIKRQGKWVIKPLFRFDKKGNATFDTSKLSKNYVDKLVRLYGTKEEIVEEAPFELDYSKMSYKELQHAYTEKTGKKSIGVKKVDILKELEG